MDKIRIFVSSVQKELEPERVAIMSLLTTDPFLLEYCEPVLFDKEPISGRKASKPYLDCLDSCSIYLLMINREYGRLLGDISATHHEYHHAQLRKMPTLIFVKGFDDESREKKTREFFGEIKKDGFTYKRFIDRLDLRIEVRAALIKVLQNEYGVSPAAVDQKSGEETLDMASPFESRQTDSEWNDLDAVVAEKWLIHLGEIKKQDTTRKTMSCCLRMRGLMWRDQNSGKHFALASGVVFLGKNPSLRFPHCRILLDAYQGTEIDPRPWDQSTLSSSAWKVIDQVLEFVNKNTRHPPRIIGIRRVALDEYPEKAVREAIVNAIAHRNYEDGSRQIIVSLFRDRIVVASPGLPPKPLTLAKLRKGNYIPCSRNPVIAQSLASIGFMEQRGSGFARMKAAMLDHGLDAPHIEIKDGYFLVTLPGPGDSLDRLRLPGKSGLTELSPSMESQLSGRQKEIIKYALLNGSVSRNWCMKTFDIGHDVAYKDLSVLSFLGLLVQEGKGRATKYIPKKENS